MNARSGTLIADNKVLEYARVGPPPAEASSLVLLQEEPGYTGLWRDESSADLHELIDSHLMFTLDKP